MLRLGIFLLWIVGFTLLNAVAKKWVQGLPPLSDGAGGLAKAVISSVWPYVMVALYMYCSVLYMAALRLMPLSVAGPLFTVSGALAAFMLGLVFFGEALTPIKTAGLALCVAGIILLSIQNA